MKRTKYEKAQLLKDIQSGKVPVEALSPPLFVFNIDDDGIFQYLIDGKSVDKEYFFNECERLHTDYEFNIKFRSETNPGR